MKTCEYLMPDDYECNDVASIKVGRKWYCQCHAEAVQTGTIPADEFDFDHEEEGLSPYGE